MTVFDLRMCRLGKSRRCPWVGDRAKSHDEPRAQIECALWQNARTCDGVVERGLVLVAVGVEPGPVQQVDDDVRTRTRRALQRVREVARQVRRAAVLRHYHPAPGAEGRYP